MILNDEDYEQFKWEIKKQSNIEDLKKKLIDLLDLFVALESKVDTNYHILKRRND